MANASTTTKDAPGPRPAPRTTGSGRGPSLAGLADYLRGVREELRKATWPSRAELIRLTQVVLAVIAVVAVYCGGLDWILSLITRRLGFGV
jgi:preprotein translocase SecE subunit